MAKLRTLHCPVDPAAPVLRSTPVMEILHVTLYVGSVRKVCLGVQWSSSFNIIDNQKILPVTVAQVVPVKPLLQVH